MWIWFLMPGCAIVLLAMWRVFGKDKKTIMNITVHPPEDLDPLEMEYAQIATISDRGIFAMLLYWVSKGILKIREHRDGGAGGEHEDEGEVRIGVERIGTLDEDAPEHARFLYEGMFKKAKTVWLDKFPAAVTEHKGELRDKVAERFVGKNAVVQDDSMRVTMTAMALLIISIFVIDVMVDVNVWLSVALAIALFCTLALLQNGALGFQSKYDTFEVLVGGIGTGVILIVQLILLMVCYGDLLFTVIFAVCFLICIPCIMFMERRANHRLYGQILGFRQYIETAEWDRLKALSEEDPNYGMEILPYAMLFQMGTKWTKQFENKTICDCVEKMEGMSKDEKKE